MAESQETALITSSVEPVFDTAQREFFRHILRRLNSEKVSYAVSGAFALHQHTGIWRGIKDLDVFVTTANMPVALTALSRNGFRCEIADPVWLAKVRCGDFFLDLITGMSNGALFVTDKWIERARPAVVLDVETRVVAAEELLASKLFVARRERFDGADIAHIIYRTAGRLDWNRVLELVGEHWELLLWCLVLFRYVYPSQADAVPSSVWTQLTQRFADQLTTPSPGLRFRGSLVDENMFAIDIREWGLDDLMAENRRRAQKIETGLAACSDNSSEG